MKVGEILELSIFKGSTVLAGHLGLERDVKYVDVFEVPDIADNWLIPETFLLSTTFAFKEFDEEYMLNLFSAMINLKVAAIAIKLGRFIETLPNSVIEMANNANFPIILLPIDFAYPKAIKEVLGKIVLTEEHSRRYKKKQDLLSFVLNNEFDKSDLHNLDILGVDERYKVRVFVVYNSACDYAEKFLRLCNKLCEMQYEFISYPENENLMVFLLYRKRTDKDLYIDVAYYDRILKSLSDHSLLMGVGKSYYLEQARTSYIEAYSSLKIAKAMAYSTGTFFYEDVELFANLISKHDKSNLIESSKRLIEPLIRYDLENNTHYFDTLKILCEVSFSKTEAAERMHIHRNTLNYRMNIIREIISLDNFSDYDQHMKLRLALMIYNFYGDYNHFKFIN